MKQYQIEETIIAYFDGRLTDSESAELLHRVSVSPEIRQIFREHESLREMASRAAANVAVRPEIEDALFARIALQQDEEKVAGILLRPASFWSIRRIGMTAAALGLLFLGTTKLLEHQPAAQSPQTFASVSAAVLRAPAEQPAAPTEHSRAVSANAYTTLTRSVRSARSIVRSPEPMPVLAAAPTEAAITPAQARPLPELGTELRSPGAPMQLAFSDVPQSTSSKFEIGAETATGFSLPADALQVRPVTDFRIHAGYFVTDNDELGLRLTSGLFQALHSSVTSVDGVTMIERTAQLERGTAEEIYYLHRFSALAGRLYIDAGAGLGLMTQGNLVSAEAGIKLPVSEHMLLGVTFTLSRLHNTSQTNDEMLNATGSGNGTPVIIEGPDIHNTLNGRLEYGLSYRF